MIRRGAVDNTLGRKAGSFPSNLPMILNCSTCNQPWSGLASIQDATRAYRCQRCQQDGNVAGADIFELALHAKTLPVVDATHEKTGFIIEDNFFPLHPIQDLDVPTNVLDVLLRANICYVNDLIRKIPDELRQLGIDELELAKIVATLRFHKLSLGYARDWPR